MSGTPPGPICTTSLGASWIDDGTAALSSSQPPGPTGSRLGDAGGRSQREGAWFQLADSIRFVIGPGEGVIFCGVDGNRARALATRSNPKAKIIHDTLDKYGFTQERMVRDFGELHSALTYRLWERVSLNYVRSLGGRVTAYVNAPKFTLDQWGLGPGRGAGAEVEQGYAAAGQYKAPSILLTEIEELIDHNPRVSSILVRDERTGAVLQTYFRGKDSSLAH